MKNLILLLLVLTLMGCQSDQSYTTSTKNKATIVEMVLWKSKEGTNSSKMKEYMLQLNDFVQQQPGFVSRKTALSTDGRFLDIVLWRDLVSAQKASEKAMKDEKIVKIFNAIDEKEMIFQHFEIFNEVNP